MISQRKLTLILLALIAAQLLLVVPAQYALIRLSGDAVYGGIYRIIDIADSVIGKITAYALLAALGIAWYYRVITARATAMYLIALALPRAAATVMAASFQSDFSSRIGGYLLQIWIDALPELVITAACVISAVLLRRRGGDDKDDSGLPGIVRVFLVSAGAFLTLELISEIINTVSFFIEYDDPTFAEIMSMATAYGLYIAYSVVGFFVMLGVMRLARETAPAKRAAPDHTTERHSTQR